METSKKKYEPPVITRVKFEEKELVSFNVCKKVTAVELDSISCCQILKPFTEPGNMNNFDPS